MEQSKSLNTYNLYVLVCVCVCGACVCVCVYACVLCHVLKTRLISSTKILRSFPTMKAIQ